MQFRSILDQHSSPEENAPVRKDREILEEILELTRLASKRSGRSISQHIHPGSVAHLISSLSNAVESIHSEDPEGALKALSGMQDPIRYLLRRIDLDGDNRDEMIARLEALEFTYGPPDDEIPF